MRETVAAPSRLRTCLHSSRPNFLLLAPLCAGLALTAAWADGLGTSGLDALLVLLGALLAHAAVNLFNEHHDYRSGLDALTQRTAFSGGSGALQASPLPPGRCWPPRRSAWPASSASVPGSCGVRAPPCCFTVSPAWGWWWPIPAG